MERWISGTQSSLIWKNMSQVPSRKSMMTHCDSIFIAEYYSECPVSQNSLKALQLRWSHLQVSCLVFSSEIVNGLFWVFYHV